MKQFTIWVDADSCPVQAKNIILKAAVRLNLYVNYVANRKIPFSIENPNFKMIVCENNEGAADNYIVENACCDDLVITRDLPFAQRLVEKNICVINDRGTVFTKENLKEKIEQRNLNMLMNACGVKTGGRMNGYGKQETYEFANCLDKILTKKVNS